MNAIYVSYFGAMVTINCPCME